MDIRDLFDYKCYKRELERYVGRRKKITIPKWIYKIGFNAFYKSEAVSINLNEVKEISKHAFRNARKLEEVILNNNITAIPDSCFENAISLSKLILTNNITKIGELAFNRCGSLENLYLPSSIQDIGKEAFKASGLKRIILPESVRNIGDAAFERCESLESVVFDCNIPVIKDSMFSYCSKLENVLLPVSVKKIEEFAFLNCTSLTHISLPRTLKIIESSSFEGSNLSKIDLSNVETIGSGAFLDCILLSEVKLNKHLKVLNEDVFSRTALKHITLPKDLEVIRKDCFSFTDLEEITIPKKVHYISSRAFSNCSHLETIVLESDDVEIDQLAFFRCPNVKKIIYKGVELDVSNVSLSHICNETLEYLYSKRDILKTLKAKIPYNCLKALDENNLLNDFVNNAYYKNYRSLCSHYNQYNVLNTSKIDESLFILAYTMGVFDKELSHKSSELIREYISNLRISDKNIIYFVSKLTFKPVDKEMIREITDMKGVFFKELVKHSCSNPLFFGMCLENYAKVQQCNNANTASHRRLRPTIEKFSDYFNMGKFVNVITEYDELIAREIGKFYNQQEIYDKARDVMNKHMSKGVVSSLISEDVRVEVHDSIEKIKRDIDYNFIKLEDALMKIYYEFLRKDDPSNLVVARYCNDSCAHINGLGEDIAFASVLDSKTQTLVIKDLNGNVISKAVFNINSDNEIIVNGIYVENIAVTGREQLVADKYIEAFNSFIKDYKKVYDVDIEGVYIGENSSLIDNFDVAFEKKGPINVLDYSEYRIDKSYSGDCYDGVLCIIDNRKKYL